jgi:proteasome lid subunit RPN8/RPN11
MAERPSLKSIPPIKPIPLIKDGRHALLRVSDADCTALKRHVFQRYPQREWGTFFRFGFRRCSWGLALSYVEPILPQAGDLDRQSGMTVFREQYSRRAFQEASRAEGLAVGVVHSHPEGFGTWPSQLDDDMDGYFSKEISAYGHGIPYSSLILQQGSDGTLTFSGRVFDRGEWFELRWLIEVGFAVNRYLSETVSVPVHLIPKESDEEESVTARLASVFGKRAERRLQFSIIGLIGCSGTGSPAAETFGRAGVGEFVLVDPQRFSKSNLERLHGSVAGDSVAEPPPYKVEILRRLLLEINPAVRVTGLIGNILHDNVLDELLRCDLLLGCTDSFHGRAALSDLAEHFLLPSIDIGVLMDGENGKVKTQLVEFTRYHPGLPCAYCSGVIDGGQMAQELMTDAERAERQAAAADAVKQGIDPDQYWKGRARQLNTVGYLTTTAGAMGAGYAEEILTGAFGLPHDRFQFDIGHERLGATVSHRTRDPRCSCGKHAGWAEQGKSYRSVLLPPHWNKRAIINAKP